MKTTTHARARLAPEALIEIPLTRGMVAVIDAADFDLVAGFKWYAKKHGKTFYAATNGPRPERRQLQMHRLILGLPHDDERETDHVDGDGLNNRRSNLRTAARQQNNCNKGLQVNNSSGFKGVHWHVTDKLFIARIQKDGRRIYLGHFKDPSEAARAYDRAAAEHHGAFARLNFP